MKTSRVHWADGAVEQAVERLKAVVAAADTERTYRVAEQPLSWMDLACLLDLARQCGDDHGPAGAKLLAALPGKTWEVEPPTLAEVADAAVEELQTGLPKALLQRGMRDLTNQVEAMARTIRKQDAELAVLREQQEPAKCSCNGGWSVDENYQPEDYEMGQPLRPEKGLIPCGLCNHGGWDAPWPPRKPDGAS